MASADPVEGLRVGPYRLLEELGRGGMGRVYRARHEASHVDVALKTVVTGRTKAGTDVVRRLLEEVRLAAQLRHRGVVEILDCGRLDASTSEVLVAFEGCPFIVMELAPGGSLAAFRGRLDFAGVKEVADQMLLALGHAHARGVLHCDVKPANILRGGPRQSLDELRLADFGVAAFYGRPAGPRYKGGTRAYMPPEQLAGDVRTMGPWSDLFSLARTLSELLVPGTIVPAAFSRWLTICLAANWRLRFPCAADARAGLLDLAEGDSTPWTPAGFGMDSGTTTSETTADDSEPIPSVSCARDPGSALPRAPWPARQVALRTAPPRVFLDDSGVSLAAFRPPPLLGRGEEQRILWSAFERAAEERTPQVVIVDGAAGIGKTRLSDWLLQRVSELGAGHGLRAEDWRDGGALARMVRGDLRAGGLRGARLREHLAAMAPGAPPALADLVDPAISVASAAAVALAADYLIWRSDDRPVVVLLDDALGEPEGQDLAMELIGRGRSAVTLVLTGNARSDAHLAPWEGMATAERLRLGPLDDADQGELIQSLCRLDAASASALATRTGGNPRYASELVRFWLDEGYLGADATSVAVEELPVPDGLADVERKRLERFLRIAPPGVGEAVELAATGGLRVSRARWIAVCEAAGLARDRCVLAEELLTRYAGLRRASVDRRLGLGDWGFERPAFREAVLLAAGPRRKRWHRLYATLASSAQARGDHLFEAGAFVPAFEALVEGASVAWQQGAHPRAHHLLVRAREALTHGNVPAEHPSLGRYLLLRGRSELALGAAAHAATSAEEAMRWGRRHGRAVDEVEAHLLRGEVQARRDDSYEASLTLEIAQELAQQHHLGHHWAEAFYAWADVTRRLPGMTAALEHAMADAAIRPAVQALPEVEGLVLLARGHFDLDLGNLEAAEDAGKRCLATLTRGTLAAVRARWLLARVERERGHLERALDRLQAVLAELKAIGAEPALLWACRADLALVHNRSGDYARTRSLLEASPRWFDAREARFMAAIVRLILLPAYAAFGDWERWDHALEAAARVEATLPDAPAEAERAGDEARAAGQTARALSAYALAGDQLYRQGRRDDLRRLLEKCRAIEREQG